jgi:hypothetical protein
MRAVALEHSCRDWPTVFPSSSRIGSTAEFVSGGVELRVARGFVSEECAESSHEVVPGAPSRPVCGPSDSARGVGEPSPPVTAGATARDFTVCRAATPTPRRATATPTPRRPMMTVPATGASRGPSLTPRSPGCSCRRLRPHERPTDRVSKWQRNHSCRRENDTDRGNRCGGTPLTSDITC